MTCSICGLAGHNKKSCVRKRAERIAAVMAKCGRSHVISLGLDAVCPGLGLTYETASQLLTLIEARKHGVSEEHLFDAMMNL